MSVYVDDMYAPFGRMKMCHMVADSSEELLAMAKKIGLKAKWIQKAGTSHEHFDVGKGVRQKAVNAGAIQITQMQLGRMLVAKRGRGLGVSTAPWDNQNSTIVEKK